LKAFSDALVMLVTKHFPVLVLNVFSESAEQSKLKIIIIIIIILFFLFSTLRRKPIGVVGGYSVFY